MSGRLTNLLDGAEKALGTGADSECAAGRLWTRDPRAKIVTALAAILTASLIHAPAILLAFYSFLLAATAASGARLGPLMRRSWAAAGLFAGAAAILAAFITPGHVIFAVPGFALVTSEGATAAARLFLRSLASAHAALLLAQTTPWMRMVRGLNGLGVPSEVVMILALAQRYLALLLEQAREMLLAREARRVGTLSAAPARRQMAAIVGALFARSWDAGEAAYRAMAARGWRGIAPASPERLNARDAALLLWAALSMAAFIAVDVLARS